MAKRLTGDLTDEQVDNELIPSLRDGSYGFAIPFIDKTVNGQRMVIVGPHPADDTYTVLRRDSLTGVWDGAIGMRSTPLLKALVVLSGLADGD